ncbi:LysR family transcriptional regulator [Brucella anthropi]|uniref:LysR substrate-binding domain-containing protein n=1 Tax=Brucella anthropi TaxID=529 RepID=UPI002157385B|nr:LysR family transcriptional regulator [Brucella anthropi]MCR8493056.1 LysR family transcriptional regulator [Brucella anthropi]
MASARDDGGISSEDAGTGSIADFSFRDDVHDGVKLHHLRYFVAAAEYGSFRQAGRALAIQESTISRRIRDLEDQLGASLFHRRHGGVRLTAAGQNYLPRARTALRHIHAGAHDVAAAGRTEQGHIKIGVFSSIASGFLFDLLQAFGKRYERVGVDLIDGNPAEHIAAVRQLRLDVAFITGTSPRDGCEVEQLWSEKVFAVLPADHRLADRTELSWPDLTGERFIISEAPPGQEIFDYLVGRLGKLGHHPEIHCQYVGRDNMLSLVAVGRGLTLTSEATTVAQFPGIIYRRMAGEVLPFCAVWSARNDNPACRRLLSLARSIA